MTDTDRACLSHWWPVVEGLPFVPETEVVERQVGLKEIDEIENGPTDRLKSLTQELRSKAEEMGGTPVFLRSGQTSGKHDWKRTCAVKDLSDLTSHILSIIEYSHVASVPGLPTNVWVLRKWLEIEHEFRAFNGTPIGHEWRYFVEDGDIQYRQPYWPPKAIRNATADDWEERLQEINRPTDLKQSDHIARKTAAAIDESDRLHGEWSVDTALTQNGWYMIDMAPGETSYRWDPREEA